MHHVPIRPAYEPTKAYEAPVKTANNKQDKRDHVEYFHTFENILYEN